MCRYLKQEDKNFDCVVSVSWRRLDEISQSSTKERLAILEYNN